MIWPYCVGACLALAIFSDRQHAIALALIAVGLIFLGVVATLIDNQMFYIASCVTWLTVAVVILFLEGGEHWRYLNAAAILLVVAGITVLPAWITGDKLVPFSSISLVLSDIIGVLAIITLGISGITSPDSWLWDLARSIRYSNPDNSVRDQAKK